MESGTSSSSDVLQGYGQEQLRDARLSILKIFVDKIFKIEGVKGEFQDYTLASKEFIFTTESPIQGSALIDTGQGDQAISVLPDVLFSPGVEYHVRSTISTKDLLSTLRNTEPILRENLVVIFNGLDWTEAKSWMINPETNFFFGIWISSTARDNRLVKYCSDLLGLIEEHKATLTEYEQYKKTSEDKNFENETITKFQKIIKDQKEYIKSLQNEIKIKQNDERDKHGMLMIREDKKRLAQEKEKITEEKNELLREKELLLEKKRTFLKQEKKKFEEERRLLLEKKERLVAKRQQEKKEFKEERRLLLEMVEKEKKEFKEERRLLLEKVEEEKKEFEEERRLLLEKVEEEKKEFKEERKLFLEKVEQEKKWISEKKERLVAKMQQKKKQFKEEKELLKQQKDQLLLEKNQLLLDRRV
jgi:hypothetical protein